MSWRIQCAASRIHSLNSFFETVVIEDDCRRDDDDECRLVYRERVVVPSNTRHCFEITVAMSYCCCYCCYYSHSLRHHVVVAVSDDAILPNVDQIWHRAFEWCDPIDWRRGEVGWRRSIVCVIPRRIPLLSWWCDNNNIMTATLFGVCFDQIGFEFWSVLVRSVLIGFGSFGFWVLGSHFRL